MLTAVFTSYWGYLYKFITVMEDLSMQQTGAFLIQQKVPNSLCLLSVHVAQNVMQNVQNVESIFMPLVMVMVFLHTDFIYF